MRVNHVGFGFLLYCQYFLKPKRGFDLLEMIRYRSIKFKKLSMFRLLNYIKILKKSKSNEYPVKYTAIQLHQQLQISELSISSFFYPEQKL